MLKQFLILALFTSLGSVGFSQVIFDESFDEAEDATIGVDDVGGYSWVTFCPECVSACIRSGYNFCGTAV